MSTPLQSVSKPATSSAVSSDALAYSANLTSGTKLIAAVVTSTQTGTTTEVASVKDAALNSFTLAGRKTGGTSPILVDVSLWAIDTPAGDVGTKPTITATLSGGTANMAMLLQEVPSLAVGNTLAAMIDGTLAGLAGAGSSGSTGSPSYTSTASSEYLVSVYGDDGGPLTYTKPSALTADANSLNTQTFANCALAYGNSTGGAEAGSWAITGSAAEWATLLVAFKLAATGGTTAATQTAAPVQAAAAHAIRPVGAAQTVAPSQAAAAPGTALAVTTASLPGAVVGAAYSQTLTASGGTPPYTWAVSSGALPSWAALNASTGVISGTPLGGEDGSTGFTVRVTDSAGGGATAAAQAVTPSQSAAATVTAGSSGPSGPSGTWTLAWNDEFNNAAGMSGDTNGLASSKWNVGWFFGPSTPGGTGYAGTSFTASSGGGAEEFYGPGALAFPGGGGMVMSCYAPGAGPDGASYSSGGHSSTAESGGVNTAGLMNITPNTGYTVPGGIAGTVIQAASIVIEAEVQMPGDDYISGDNNVLAGGYWPYIGLYNCGDCSTPGYPNSGTWTEEIDIWEGFGALGAKGPDYFLTFHAASSYGSIVSTPSSLASTDLSLAMHKFTVEFTYTTTKLWVDGVAVSGISPTAAECQAQWATPQYLNLQLQLIAGYIATGASSGGHTATPMKVGYVRVFTQ